MVGGAPLESWIGWVSGDTSLNIAPDNDSQVGVHTVEVTFTPTDGSPVTYVAVSITVQATGGAGGGAGAGAGNN